AMHLAGESDALERAQLASMVGGELIEHRLAHAPPAQRILLGPPRTRARYRQRCGARPNGPLVVVDQNRFQRRCADVDAEVHELSAACTRAVAGPTVGKPSIAATGEAMQFADIGAIAELHEKRLERRDARPRFPVPRSMRYCHEDRTN